MTDEQFAALWREILPKLSPDVIDAFNKLADDDAGKGRVAVRAGLAAASTMLTNWLIGLVAPIANTPATAIPADSILENYKKGAYGQV